MSDAAAFFAAVVDGDLARVQALLAARPALARVRDADGATALHHAAFHGHRALVALLVAHGAEVNARDAAHDATPAGWAVHQLRELGGLLTIEIEDALHAIHTRDVAWTRRLVMRHPALVHAVDAHGRPLAAHARDAGDPAIAALFAPASAARAPTP
jgi:hypothetical protein